MDQNSILGLINDNVYGIWFLVGAALVFFMQCGFAMVEAGFTRAKNAGNIIMKNLMDFCLGTVVFILIGFGLLCGEDLVGIIGKPGFDIFSDYANFDCPVSYSTWYSAQQRQRSFPVPWQNVQSSFPIVSIPQ